MIDSFGWMLQDLYAAPETSAWQFDVVRRSHYMQGEDSGKACSAEVQATLLLAQGEGPAPAWYDNCPGDWGQSSCQNFVEAVTLDCRIGIYPA